MRSRSPLHLTALLALAFAALCLGSRIVPAQVLAGSAVGSRNGSSAPSQPANVPTVTIHVTGVVVSSLDGKPVPRALVTSMDRHFAALTDWQGRFGFDYRMPAPDGGASAVAMSGFGAVSMGTPFLGLVARKPGYVNASALPSLAPGATTSSIQLKITPACVISGHVTPDSGELPNGLRASLLHRQARDGIGQWTQAGTVQVDRNGDFRFADLSPGDYIAMTSAWSQPLGFGLQNRPDTTRGLLPTYYPGTATLAEATPIHARPGETADISLRPSSATFYRVSLGVDGLSGPNFGASLISNAGFMLGTNNATHTIEGYLPTGSYTLRVQTFSPGAQPTANIAGPPAIVTSPLPGNRTTSFAHLEVGSAPLIGRAITAAPAADVQVNVTRNFTSTQQQPTIELAAGPSGSHRNPPVFVDLQRADESNIYSNSGQDVDGDTITLHNIPEGSYHLHITAPQGYVASAISGSTNLLTTPLPVGGGSAAPIYVTLRDDFASLACRLQTNEVPDITGGQTPIFIVAIPLDTPEVRMMPMGSFPQQFRTPISLPPGRYLLLAGPPDRIQTLEYRNPEVLHELMNKGITVSLAPGEKASVDVPLMSDGDN